MTATLHRDSWDQYAAICEKQIADLTAENERLRAALTKCAELLILGDERGNPNESEIEAYNEAMVLLNQQSTPETK